MRFSVKLLRLSITLLLPLCVAFSIMTTAQETSPPCGFVDGLQFPVESVESATIAEGYDDFNLFRNRFGGYHVGLDIGFYQQGAPVFAAARGQVTYADPAGWDTEGGVIILEHYFPDGNRLFSVYGHVEESDTIRLPQAGDCVGAGDVIGAVGNPDSSAPHMHFEIRNFLANDGGPGYTDGNPLAAGWFHPLDFMYLWELRLLPAFVSTTTFQLVPMLPPVSLDDGTYAVANENLIAVYAPDGRFLWRIIMDEAVNGLVGLPGARFVARSNSGQMVNVSGGRYNTAWQMDTATGPLVTLGEMIITLTDVGGLQAYNPQGEMLWSLPGYAERVSRVNHFETNSSTLSVSVLTSQGYAWRIVDQAGGVIHESLAETFPIVTPRPDGTWLAVAQDASTGQHLIQISAAGSNVITPLNIELGNKAQLTTDLIGNVYLYTDDSTDTLLSLNPYGGERWRTVYPGAPEAPPLLTPLLAVDSGCLLYTLDEEGVLSVLNAQTGELVTQHSVYPGGDRNGYPNSRVLRVEPNGWVVLNAGFISTVTLDGNLLGARVMESCLLG